MRSTIWNESTVFIHLTTVWLPHPDGSKTQKNAELPSEGFYTTLIYNHHFPIMFQSFPISLQSFSNHFPIIFQSYSNHVQSFSNYFQSFSNHFQSVSNHFPIIFQSFPIISNQSIFSNSFIIVSSQTLNPSFSPKVQLFTLTVLALGAYGATQGGTQRELYGHFYRVALLGVRGVYNIYNIYI